MPNYFKKKPEQVRLVNKTYQKNIFIALPSSDKINQKLLYGKNMMPFRQTFADEINLKMSENSQIMTNWPNYGVLFNNDLILPKPTPLKLLLNTMLYQAMQTLK